ncbi:putative meiotically up-regulated gene protein [Calycina marina]|uniref:Meiotically up-regulated gene protein n=1 Tax=Calycina marina TaxID=1763456 RepID=A0A9P7Z2K7_9HELO|nr:putative meiotically up-regulated gene protein [Calycina marina]
MDGTNRDFKGDADKEETIALVSPTSAHADLKPEDDFTTKALRFLSTASVETIGGIAVGLAACTYFVLGRLGLVLIGAVGGIVLHATWETQQSESGTAEEIRREKALDIVKRLLDLESAKARDVDAELEPPGSSFEGFRPETAAALNDLVDAVVRDYVKWWYTPILPQEQSFSAATKQTLTKFILAISNHLSKKRPADAFLNFLTNSSSIIIVFLSELSRALSDVQGNTTPVEAVHAYLNDNPTSSLANVLDQGQQAKKFSMIAEDILANFLDNQTFKCETSKIFLREMLAGVVLETTLKSCSKPEWINGWIVYLLESGEPDMNQAIDAGMGTANTSSNIDAIDGNLGGIGVAKAPKSLAVRQEEKGHKKRLSKAEEAMEAAMEEARRLSTLIAEDEKKKKRESTTQVDGLGLPFEHQNQAQIGTGSPEKTHPESQKDGSPTPESKPPVFDLASPDWGNSDAPVANSAPTLPPVSQPRSPKSVQTAVAAASKPHESFTSFDQILPIQPPPLLQRGQTVSLTLHNANIVIFDDSTPMETGRIRNKPNGDILIQIEPKSEQHPGWMIVRRYSDFETLHEVLRRIAQISGVTAFTEQHHFLPKWKEHTKASLRGELERYLKDACWYQPLAESEGMKRFLEKDQGQGSYGKEKAGFGWPTPSAFENMGKGMLDVLTSAPKGVAGGGKMIGSGIGGVFTNLGNLGQKKPAPAPTSTAPPTPATANAGQTNGFNGNASNIGMHYAGRSSTSSLSKMGSASQISLSSSRVGRASEDSSRATTPIIQTQPSKIQPMERRPSHNIENDSEREIAAPSTRSSISLGRRSANHSREPSLAPVSRRGTPLSSPLNGSMERFSLPPPPIDMPNDWYQVPEDSASSRRSTSTAPQGRASLTIPRQPSEQVTPIPTRRLLRDNTPLTEPETKVAIELMFAVINELYTLSSAWNIRRTLLTAAKQFLLRPGNPSLSSIQSLIQDSIIASNTSDTGIASHLRKIRENALPTAEELKAWPAEMTAEEKKKLRIKARALFVANAIPEALKGVMGQAAAETAMARIFDLVQEGDVARGLIFGLILQGVRAVTH